MTKKEFENSDKPLAFIGSIDPKTGKVLYDTYDYETSNGWYDEIKEDFPEMFHFKKINKAAIEERKKRYGLTN